MRSVLKVNLTTCVIALLTNLSSLKVKKGGGRLLMVRVPCIIVYNIQYYDFFVLVLFSGSIALHFDEEKKTDRFTLA